MQIFNYLEMTFAVLQVTKLTMLTLFLSHLQACAWGCLPAILASEGDITWIQVYVERAQELWGREVQVREAARGHTRALHACSVLAFGS